ncbi:MAG: hypothetical protein M8349_01265 [ANME-2 cluster archaeon]|nr:hypothetical protein [ANME-2 cluster archaeon]
MGIKAAVANIEPADILNNVPHLSYVNYTPIMMSLREALNAHMPFTVDCLLMVRSAHEIALCNTMSSSDNKKRFFHDLDSFIEKTLHQEAKSPLDSLTIEKVRPLKRSSDSAG